MAPAGVAVGGSHEELLFNGDGVSVWDDGKVLDMESGDGWTICMH